MEEPRTTASGIIAVAAAAGPAFLGPGQNENPGKKEHQQRQAGQGKRQKSLSSTRHSRLLNEGEREKEDGEDFIVVSTAQLP